MIVLAIDTCDSRGSVALWREGAVLAIAEHDSGEEYSSWLLPAVARVLERAGLGAADVDAYGVASGPGSFTGVRVGLTTVKAWCEVYGKPGAAVSRLGAMAWQVSGEGKFIAAFANAQKGLVFGAVYRRDGTGLEVVREEMVIAPGKFVELAAELAQDGRITWVTTDPEQVLADDAWKNRETRGEGIESVSCFLAPAIAAIAAKRMAKGQLQGALELDANYVQRPAAETYWKVNTTRGS